MTNDITALIRAKDREIKRQDKKISDTQALLDKLKHDRALADAERNGLVQAAKVLGVAIESEIGAGATKSVSIDRLDPGWVSILHQIFLSGVSPFGYEDVMIAGDRIGRTLKKPSVRTQILSYVKSGVLERIMDGKFQFKSTITDELRAYKPDIESKPPKVSLPSGVSSSTEDVDASFDDDDMIPF